ncbi:MAG: serine/threonine protein kinase [Chloracidobacterium sp.]|nr:serine/threonine protein kinase [Chloracidobacterium sp.]
MSDIDWQNVKDIFIDALELDESQRSEFLSERCNGETDMRSEVESLLRSHFESEDFIENPAIEVSEIFGNKDVRIDQQFGHYTIEREIGHGGMGAVFLARRNDGEFDQKVALKIVRQSIAEHHIIERFKNERQILASLSHPNIARLLDGGVADSGEPFIAMEYIEGVPIDEFATSHDFSINQKLRLFIKVCSAVAYAHRNLIIHRDIKPGNILVGTDGEPKLLDFGLAKLTDERLLADPSQTQTAFRALTPAYASPEQLKGDVITTSSDVYSLGILLFELLTGERPFRFEGKMLDEIIRTVAGTAPALPSKIAMSASHDPQLLKGDLDNIILCALRNEPERRYHSVEALAEDIERHLNGLPVSARPNTFSYRTGTFIKRNKIAVATASLVLISIFVGLGATLWQSRVAAKERDQALHEQKKSEQLSNFLQTILSSASPEESGKDTKVIEMLDNSAGRIDEEFADQPELRAQALLTIGKTYTQLSLLDKAGTVLRKALDLSTDIYGTENKTTSTCMMYLGTVNMGIGKFDEAEKLLTEGTEIDRRLSPKGSNELAYGLNALGEFYVRKAEYERSKPILQESISIYDDLFGANNKDSAFVMISVGRAQAFAGDKDGAETTFRQALAIYEQLPIRYELRIAFIKINLGNLLANRGNYDEGIALMLDAEATFAKKQGDSFNTFNSKVFLCRAYFLKGAYDQAATNGTIGIEMARKLNLKNNPSYVEMLLFTGLSLSRGGTPQKGEELLREGLKVAENGFPGEVADAKGCLGENLAAQKRFVEAQTLLSESYESLKASVGEQSPRTVQVKNLLDSISQTKKNTVPKTK